MNKITPIDWTAACRWYDAHASDYELATLTRPIPEELLDFAEGLPQGARVLDAGCGAGRDARWLHDRGFRVSGFDISSEMIAAARANTCGKVDLRVLDFERYDDPAGSWDGIWAMASLLHLPKSSLNACLERLLSSLTEHGQLFLALKEGQGEALDPQGRPFSYYQPDELLRIAFAAMPGPGHIASHVSTVPAAHGEQTRWINLDIRRTPAL